MRGCIFLLYVLCTGGAIVIPLLVMYAGAGVTLGHNFPFYMNFKGGKGIAVMAGLVFINSVWHMPQSLFLDTGSLALFFFIACDRDKVHICRFSLRHTQHF